MTTLPQADFDLATTLRYEPQRLHDFLYLRGLFASELEADYFWQMLGSVSEAGYSPMVQIQILRRAFAECCKTADRYGKSTAKRSQDAVQQLLDTLGANQRPESLLDLGCGTGDITSALAAHWSLSPDQAVGTDIYPPADTPENIRFVRMSSGSLAPSVLNRRFDLAVAALVLHHTASPFDLMRQLADVLVPGGHLVLREHNADSDRMHYFLNTIHVLYEEVFPDQPQPLSNAQNYLSIPDWHEMAAACGLRPVSQTYDDYAVEAKNTSQNFTAVFRKL